jgi:hypothetical protein
MTRHESAQDFFCDRCQQNKKAKNIAEWQTTNNEKKTICNGCYGFLLSQSK